MIEYKGYTGEPRYVPDDKVFHGRLDGIRDVIAFEATTAAEVETAFREAVDDYLNYCRKVGKEPETPRATRITPPRSAAGGAVPRKRSARPKKRPTKIVVELASDSYTVKDIVKAVKDAMNATKKAAMHSVKGVKGVPAKGSKGARRTAKSTKRGNARRPSPAG